MTKQKETKRQVTSLEDLKAQSEPLVDIPGFDTGQTITVKLRKPRIMEMVAAGKIPNHLMGVAATVVKGQGNKNQKKLSEEEEMKMLLDTMDLFVRVCLVEPKYEDVKEILTEDQKGYIMEWAMGTVDQLNNFRNDTADGPNDNDSPKTPASTK